MNYVLIDSATRELVTEQTTHKLKRYFTGDPSDLTAPDGQEYVLDLDRPSEELQPGHVWQRTTLDDGYGWTQRALTPEEMAETVPDAVQMVQLREQLIRDGLKANVEAAIAGIPDAVTKEIVNEWWEYATIVRRDNAKVMMVAQALSLTSEAIDELFINASKR